MVAKGKYYSREQVAARLIELRESVLRVTQPTFAAALDIPVSTLRTYEQCRADISVEFIARLHNKLNVNSQWLLFGIGDDPLEHDKDIAEMVNLATASVVRYAQKRGLALTAEKQGALVAAVYKRLREEPGRNPDVEANELVELAS
jgi:transcriptional regulator with XRE-family HTH domain